MLFRETGGRLSGVWGNPIIALKAFIPLKEAHDMKKYICTVCGYVYDPANGDPDSGIAPGTAFEDIPDEWVCPVCGVAKDMFEVAE